MSLSRVRIGHAFALVLAAGAAMSLSSVFLIGSTPDEEEFRFAVLSAWLRIRAIADGDYGFWTSLLGFGVPQPFVPHFTLHPLVPLLAWLSPVSWVRVLLVVHTVLGAIGMWRLGAAIDLRPVVRATGVVTFLLAAPVQNYVLWDFWPSHYVVWTLSPWLLMMAWHLVSAETLHVRRLSVGLGMTAGLVAANANPAYLLVFAPLGVVVVAVHWRMATARWRSVALSAAMALAIASPTVAQLAVERTHFAPELVLSNVTEPLSLRSVVASTFAPLTKGAPDTRSLSFGAPYTILAIVGCAWFSRARPDLALTTVLVAVLLFTTWIPAPWISQRYQFRDPLTLCGILLAGLALNELWQRSRLRSIAAVVAAAQVVFVAIGVLPVLQRMWDAERRQAATFRGATGDMAVMDMFAGRMREPGRLLYSPRVEHDVSERGLLPEGLGVNAAVYRGIAVVNGSFKGVSTDTISPNERLFYGRIRTPPPLVGSDGTLDVLGIRYVVAFRDEPLAAGLAPIASARTARGRELVLLENADAWPRAVLIDADFGNRDVPVLNLCNNARLLCRDLSVLVPHRDPRPVQIAGISGTIRVRFTPVASTTVLVVSEMFRPDWIATSGDRRLHTRSMYGGLLGVPLPAGVSEVRLEYRPIPLLAATLASYLALLAGVVAIVPGSRFRVPGSRCGFYSSARSR